MVTNTRDDDLPRFEHITWAEAKRIDEICDLFEARWKDGDQPAIEEFLDAAGDAERAALLRELLAIDVEYRRRAGHAPSLEKYLERLPDDAQDLREIFETAPAVDAGPMAGDGLDTPDPEAPLPFSDFELGTKLGETGMSTVYAAVQKSLGKRVALKVLRMTHRASAAAVRRFLQEARAVARLRHADIVDVHGVGRTDDGGYFLVMDLVDGFDLEERIARGSIPFREAAGIVATVASAVEHAHENGIIHRDLKPSNVLLENGSRPLLTDFGLAKHLEEEIARLSGPNDVLGTPCYMAPEQADCRWGAVSPRTDVFGLGAVLYALLVRTPPFDGHTLSDVLARVRSPDPPPSPRAVRPEVPGALERICMRCLRKDPSARFRTAGEVASALRGWLALPGTILEDGEEPEEIARRIREADEAEALDLIRRLEQSGRSAAVRALLRSLSHASQAVRKRAGKALLRIGWDAMARVIERAARDGLEDDLAAALEALRAFEAHADSVSLLERLVPVLTGGLRHQAILILERKQLALTTDRITALFREIESRYRIERALGQGPFTASFQARDERFGIPVVVRLLRPELASQPDLAASFLDLGRQSYAHVHQNLLAVRDIGSAPERQIYYIVRDYVEGITLHQLLKDGKSFTPEQVVDILSRLCEALAPIHADGLVHGGVKPSNIFVEGDGGILLGDRTLPVHKCNVPFERLSYDFAYVAPEAATGEARAGPASDLYSVGCIAYELMAGRPPFLSSNPMDLVVMHARDPVPPLSSPRVTLGSSGERFVRLLLDKNPANRVRDVRTALEELRAIAASLRSPEMRFMRVEATEPLASSSVIERLEASQLSLGVEAEPAPPGSSFGPPRSAPLEGIRVAAGPDPLPRKLRGYHILRLLGKGGMGEVYEAFQMSLGRKAVLKVMQGRSHEMAARFLREARVMSRLSNPRVVPVYDLFEEAGRLVIAMEFMEGGSLGTLLHREGPVLPLCRALALAEDVAEALAHAHGQGVLHRDVKPSNILLDGEGRGYLADFGLAGILSKIELDDTRVTQALQVLGTPSYMAPEQFDPGPPDPAADVYSLGVTAYQMLSGKLPYRGQSVAQLAVQAARGNAEPLQRFKVPKDVASLVERMMHTNPRKRPTAADAVAELGSLRAKHCSEAARQK